MNRTIKDAAVKRFHYGDHDQLRTPLTAFMAALRIHLQNLEGRARQIHPKSDPPDAGTEHLA
jgi:RNA-directed DNA polymerase